MMDDIRDVEVETPNEARERITEAARFGEYAARRFFASRSRGRNVEVHLSEAELADLIAFGWEMGTKGRKAP